MGTKKNTTYNTRLDIITDESGINIEDGALHLLNGELRLHYNGVIYGMAKVADLFDEVISFDKLTPTTVGVVFSPNTPATEDVLYLSSVDASTWIYNGTTYATQAATTINTASWYVVGTTIDAGGSKTVKIERSGAIYLNGSHDSDWMLNILNSGTTNAHGLAMFVGASSTGIPFRAGKGTSNYFSVNNNGTISLLNYTLPLADGTIGQSLKTDGTGVLYWG